MARQKAGCSLSKKYCEALFQIHRKHLRLWSGWRFRQGKPFGTKLSFRAAPVAACEEGLCALPATNSQRGFLQPLDSQKAGRAFLDRLPLFLRSALWRPKDSFPCSRSSAAIYAVRNRLHRPQTIKTRIRVGFLDGDGGIAASPADFPPPLRNLSYPGRSGRCRPAGNIRADRSEASCHIRWDGGRLSFRFRSAAFILASLAFRQPFPPGSGDRMESIACSCREDGSL